MALVTKNLKKNFHSNRGDSWAVKNFSLSVQRGELVTLLGPSGCGKTTALRLVAGLERPSEGTIEIAGQNMDGLPPHKRPVAMVFQSYALFPHMSVFENVAFGLRIRKLPKKEIMEKVFAMLSLVGLSAKTARATQELSGGEQQRVALARALVVNPEILLCDEPFSNLDQSLRFKMREEIKRLQKELGLTILFVTHDQEEAFYLSDKIVLMDHGEIIQTGTPKDFYENPTTPFVKEFLGSLKKMDGVLVRVVTSIY